MAVSDPPIYSAPNTQRDQVLSVLSLPLDSIRPSPLNPRQRFDEEQLQQLAESLRHHGMLEPVVVRPDPEQTDRGLPRFLLIAGERRWRAAKLAGLERIPARVLPEVVSDAAALELTLIENLQRQDLDPIEEATGYKALAELGWKQAAIAKAVNRSQPTIANAIRLLKLPADVIDRIQAGELTPSHGLGLARFAGFPAVASKLAEWAVKNHWSSKDLDSGLPSSWQLMQDRVIRGVSSAQFDAAVCQACPFDAYRKDGRNMGMGMGYCLKPEHFDELQDEALLALRAKAAAAREAAQAQAKPTAAPAIPGDAWQKPAEAAAADGEGEPVAPASPASLPKVNQVRGCYVFGGIGSEARFPSQVGEGSRPRPDDCSPETCPCAGRALDHGDREVEICTDQYGRLQQLQARQTRKRNKLGRAVLAEKLKRLETALDTLDGIDWRDPLDSRALAILVAAATEGRRREEPISIAIERHAKGVLTEKSLTGYGNDPTYQQLAMLAPRELLRLGLEWILRHEIANRWDGPAYGGTVTPQTDWFLAKHGTPTEVDQKRPLVEPGPNPCADCGAQLDGEDCPSCDAELNALAVETCRVCGCTDENACEGGCMWIGERLCSSCVDQVAEAEDA